MVIPTHKQYTSCRNNGLLGVDHISAIMKLSAALFLFSLFISLANSESAVWDTLSVTFKKFNKLPMSEINAMKKGWSLIADNCKDSSGPFLGRRYMLNNDHATILVFDINGRVAGLQMAYKTSAHGPVRKYAGAYQVVKEEGRTFYYLTAYFTDPKNICSMEVVRDRKTVGDKLIFLVGKDKYVEAPSTQKGIEGTKWILGKCFALMGTHYWYDVSQDMDCSDHFPYFILYNQKQLVGWGFATPGMTESPRLEHIPAYAIQYFFQEKTTPGCFIEEKARTSQHVYFTKVGRFTHTCEAAE